MSDLMEGRLNPEAASSHERETLPAVDFEAYRRLCDTLDEFRNVGIQYEDAYAAALEDERTVFAEFGGLSIPVLTPLENETMYNEARTLALSGKKKALLLAIPYQILEEMGFEPQRVIDEDTVVVVEEFVGTEGSIRRHGHDVSDLPFVGVRAIDFKNPNLVVSPENETAWMAAYGFHVAPKDREAIPYEGQPLVTDIMREWNSYCEEKGQPTMPDEQSTGTFILSAEQLGQRPDIIRQLWDISQIGFGEILGEGHPVSMEFNEDIFYEQIVAENAVVSIHCIDGEIVTFAFLGLDMKKKSNEWINDKSTAIKAVTQEAEDTKQALVHLHELIGRGKRGMGHSAKILKTFFEVVSRTGYEFSVFFESTNMSSMYILLMVERNMAKSETMKMTSEIVTYGKLSYWGIVADDTRVEDLAMAG